jgi:hypothetical protein
MSDAYMIKSIANRRIEQPKFELFQCAKIKNIISY